MDIIKNNPYRVIGILVGTSTKEEHNKIKKLKMYIDADQDVPEDFSFPIIGDLNRTIKNVDDAISKLNLNENRVKNSIFWFFKGNVSTDEPAFDALKIADVDKAITIWTKLTIIDELTQDNSSAFQNLSTILLSNAFNSEIINKNQLEQGIVLKLKFLESEFIGELKNIATDQTYKTSKKELQLIFLNQINSEIENITTINSLDFFEIIKKLEFYAKNDFLKSFVQKLIEKIEKRIEKTKNERINEKSKSVVLGNKLFEETKNDLKQIKDFLGLSNYKFISISDKVAEELLQCGDDYFNCHKKSVLNSVEIVLELFEKAQKLALGNVIKQRYKENISGLKEIILNNKLSNHSKNIDIYLKKNDYFDKITIKLIEGIFIDTFIDVLENKKKFADINLHSNIYLKNIKLGLEQLIVKYVNESEKSYLDIILQSSIEFLKFLNEKIKSDNESTSRINYTINVLNSMLDAFFENNMIKKMQFETLNFHRELENSKTYSINSINKEIEFDEVNLQKQKSIKVEDTKEYKYAFRKLEESKKWKFFRPEVKKFLDVTENEKNLEFVIARHNKNIEKDEKSLETLKKLIIVIKNEL